MGKKDYTFTFLTDYDVDFSEDESEANNVVPSSPPPSFPSPSGFASDNIFHNDPPKSKPKKTNEKQMPKEDFEEKLTKLLTAFGEVLKKQDGLFGDFVIDEVELGLGITASIGIAIVSGGVDSSFKIKFKRK